MYDHKLNFWHSYIRYVKFGGDDMTALEVIILSILCEKDAYGYEIESIIEERHIRSWTNIGFSSIYNSLNKLEKKDYIQSYMKKEYGSPERKVYTINEQTKEIVYKEITKLLSSAEKFDHDFSLGMAFSHLLTKDEQLSALKDRLANLAIRKQQIHERYAEQEAVQNVPHLKALFTRPIKLIEAETEWLNEYINEQS